MRFHAAGYLELDVQGKGASRKSCRAQGWLVSAADEVFGLQFRSLYQDKKLVAFQQDVFSFNFHRVSRLVFDFWVHEKNPWGPKPLCLL
jgi:hypothetical protein